LALSGFATSIDAMAIGAGVAFVNVNICSAAAAIDLATATMVIIEMLLGRVIGSVVGRRAQLGRLLKT
jgi:putative Mn2+ efflux pump MntP